MDRISKFFASILMVPIIWLCLLFTVLCLVVVAIIILFLPLCVLINPDCMKLKKV